jgi:hypothetical protein
VTEDKLTVEAADKEIVRLGRAALDALGDLADPPGTVRGVLPVSVSLSNVWQALRDSLEDIQRRASSSTSSPGPVRQEPTEPGSDVA